MIDYKFKPRKRYQRYDKSKWNIPIGKTIPMDSIHEAQAFDVWARARGWRIRREKLPNGTYVSGRFE